MLVRLIMLFVFFVVPFFAKAQEQAAAARPFRPGDQELFFMPTAYTMPAGSAYFEDYELFFLNFTAAVSSRTHIGFFTVFPITSDFLQTITLGIKQNFYTSDEVSAAVFASYTPKAPIGSLGGVVSFGPPATNGHIGYMRLMGGNDSQGNVIMAGLSHRVSAKTSVIIEYENALATDSDFNGIAAIGLRFAGESISWDIAGIRPLEKTPGLLFLPYLKVVVML